MEMNKLPFSSFSPSGNSVSCMFGDTAGFASAKTIGALINFYPFGVASNKNSP